MDGALTARLLQAGIIALSTTNVVLQAWLGPTVLLGSDRRRPGLWLTSGALMAGALFFSAHGVIAGYGPEVLVAAIGIDLGVGWTVGLLLPLAWYLAVLWHMGYWESRRSGLRGRHRWWPAGAVALILLPLLCGPRAAGGAGERAAAAGTLPSPPVLLAYCLAVALCVLLTLDALRHPGPTARLMGQLARERARPWLAATGIVLGIVSLIVAGMMVCLALGQGGEAPERLSRLLGQIEWAATPAPGSAAALTLLSLDAAACLMVLVAVLLIGRATVAYEVFAGRALPRHYLRRGRHAATALAVLMGLLVGVGQGLLGHDVLTVQAAVLLATGFVVLSGRWAQTERDRHLQALRPLSAAPRAYEALLEPSCGDVDGAEALGALCRDVLDGATAHLVPVGALSAFAGPAVSSPPGRPTPSVVSTLRLSAVGPGTICLRLPPGEHGEVSWAVPLWSPRGMVGLLLLGNKSGGGLYTQEEMEIARDACERLLDTLACARMARQLMAVQRRRLAESRMADHRARRLLHDEVLPGLHAAILDLAGGAATDSVGRHLAAVHRRVSGLLRELPLDHVDELSRGELLSVLRRAIEDEFHGAFSSVEWDVEPEGERLARDLHPPAAEVLFYATREAARNAARHAGNDVTLRLSVRVDDGLSIVVEDNGVGFDPTAGTDSRGMALHSAMMAVIGGQWTVHSAPGEATRVTLHLPRTLPWEG